MFSNLLTLALVIVLVMEVVMLVLTQPNILRLQIQKKVRAILKEIPMSTHQVIAIVEIQILQAIATMEFQIIIIITLTV